MRHPAAPPGTTAAAAAEDAVAAASRALPCCGGQWVRRRRGRVELTQPAAVLTVLARSRDSSLSRRSTLAGRPAAAGSTTACSNSTTFNSSDLSALRLSRKEVNSILYSSKNSSIFWYSFYFRFLIYSKDRGIFRSSLTQVILHIQGVH